MRAMIFLFGCLLFVSIASAGNDAEGTYKARCASCHGANGDGNGHAQMRVRPEDLRSPAVQKKSNEELYSAIALGAGHTEYPHEFSKRGLSTTQIQDLVSYIRTFSASSKKK